MLGVSHKQHPASQLSSNDTTHRTSSFPSFFIVFCWLWNIPLSWVTKEGSSFHVYWEAKHKLIKVNQKRNIQLLRRPHTLMCKALLYSENNSVLAKSGAYPSGSPTEYPRNHVLLISVYESNVHILSLRLDELERAKHLRVKCMLKMHNSYYSQI